MFGERRKQDTLLLQVDNHKHAKKYWKSLYIVDKRYNREISLKNLFLLLSHFQISCNVIVYKLRR